MAGDIRVKVVPDTSQLDKDLKKKRRIGLLPDFGNFDIGKSLGLDKILGKLPIGGGVKEDDGGIIKNLKKKLKSLDKSIEEATSVGEIRGLQKEKVGVTKELGKAEGDKKGGMGGILKALGPLALILAAVSSLDFIMKPVMSLFKAIIALLFMPLIPIFIPALKIISKFIPILAKVMKKVSDLVGRFVEILGDGISWVWENILAPIWEGLKEAFSILIEQIISIWEKFLLPAILIFAGVFQRIFDLIMGYFQGQIDVVKEIWEHLKSFFKGEITVKELVWGFIKSLFKGIINVVELVWGFIKLLFKGNIAVVEMVWGFIKTLFKGTIDVKKIIGGWISSFFRGSGGGGGGGSKSVGDAIIRPNGQVITTDPRDTLIATKTPEALVNGTGGGNFTFSPTINIQGGGDNPEEFAKQVAQIAADELSRRTGSLRF